jgi:hypothetical protein
MEHKSLLKQYTSRLIRQSSFLITGIFGFLLAFILNYCFPGVFVEWAPYVITVGIAVVVGSYFVFANAVREFEGKKDEYKHTVSQLEFKLSQLEYAQPRITVGFQDDARRLVKTVQLQLRPLPPKPDFDALVEEERKRLLAKSPSRGKLVVPMIYYRRNAHYGEEVEQYLIEYRDYLLKRYERRVAEDRTRSLVPVVENQGYYPANNVTIEFEMPGAYRQPEKHQLCETEITEEDLEGLGGSGQELRELEDRRICGFPREPEPFTSVWAPSLSTVWAATGGLSPSVPLAQAPGISKTSGPVHEDREGVHFIVYQIQQLVQHRPEDDFEPLFLWLGDVGHSVVWKIPVTITSADLREPLQEVLQLDIGITEEAESA